MNTSVKLRSLGQIVKRYGTLVVSLTILVSLLKNVTRIGQAGDNIQEAQARLVAAQGENKRLTGELAAVRSEAYIDRQAHDKLGLAKEGEVVLILPEEEILRNFSPRRERRVEDNLPDPIWRRWLKLFT